MNDQTKNEISRLINEHWPNVRGIYLFGSTASGEASANSDIDLAVLSDLTLNGEQGFVLKSALSVLLRKDVDLVDLLHADTVTRAQVVSTGTVLFARDPTDLAFFETTAFSQYAHLNEERRGIVEDIIHLGRVHG